MAGGYQEDRFVQGGAYDRAYRLYDWGLIDTFVYFSHSLVTVPPGAWIDVAHRNGTRFLGTFITEWDAGAVACKQLFASEAAAEALAVQLSKIARDGGFDGWLINIENPLTKEATQAGSEGGEGSSGVRERPPLVNAVLRFLTLLTRLTKEATGGAGAIIWYDSVTADDGKLDWQNCLNRKNEPFFAACDGIFTNYTWKDEDPQRSAALAAGRRYDVYVGIDVFGRGTWGGGGYDTAKALAKIRRAGVSAAIFAPAWTMEDQTPGGGRMESSSAWQVVEANFAAADTKLWGAIVASWPPARALAAPPAGNSLVMTSFGRGVGSGMWIAGQQVAAAGQWPLPRGRVASYDLYAQDAAPLALGPGAGGRGGAYAVYSCAWEGPSCLGLSGMLTQGKTAMVPLFRVAREIPPGALAARIVFRASAGAELTLMLVFSDSQGKLHDVLLRAPKDTSVLPVEPAAVGSSRAAAASIVAAVAAAAAAAPAAASRRVLFRESRNGTLSAYTPVHTAATPASGTIPPLQETAEREVDGEEGVAGAALTTPAGPALGPWVERYFVLRDPQLIGQTLQEVRVVAAVPRLGEVLGGSSGHAAAAAAAADDAAAASIAGGEAAVVPVAFRYCIGAVSVGPWVAPGAAFVRIRRFFAYDMDVVREERTSGVEAKLGVTLAWEVEGEDATAESYAAAASEAGAAGAAPQRQVSAALPLPPPPLHWDVWASDDVAAGGVADKHGVSMPGEWTRQLRWAGRAYGSKLRVAAMPVKLAGVPASLKAGEGENEWVLVSNAQDAQAGTGEDASGADSGAVSASVVFVLQQVDAAGRRQPLEQCCIVSCMAGPKHDCSNNM